MSAVVPRHLRAVSSSQWVPPPEHGPVCKDCPNIIFSLTDDQDTLLGGWEPMRHTKRLLQNSGALLTEWRIHTPICSPSRSESISGRYFHNIKSDLAVPPMKVNPAASAHINSSLYINQSFGVYLRQLRGYQTGIFGKANFNTMEGFDRWFQGAFLGYGGVWEDNESPDFQYHASKDEYATSLLGNKSIEWLSRDNVTGKTSDDRPFFLYFAPHCPHIPATPAKWYENECKGTAAPRTPNYNYSDPSFHELVSRQPPLNQTEADDIDQLARLRCQCLLSVDDAHLALYEKLEELGQLNKSTGSSLPTMGTTLAIIVYRATSSCSTTIRSAFQVWSPVLALNQVPRIQSLAPTWTTLPLGRQRFEVWLVTAVHDMHEFLSLLALLQGHV
eukprot:TRINITY_DN11568_c0_g1_i7.p1 TRINITY_DN11568_c0_g1~~TRINITY_DN11568_c0_g1_i7.p1  ORF type:complete len:388 (+),score=44.17 TRINITY_DN11568_c0_g1_i7:39-1202(+)